MLFGDTYDVASEIFFQRGESEPKSDPPSYVQPGDGMFKSQQQDTDDAPEDNNMTFIPGTYLQKDVAKEAPVEKKEKVLSSILRNLRKKQFKQKWLEENPLVFRQEEIVDHPKMSLLSQMLLPSEAGISSRQGDVVITVHLPDRSSKMNVVINIESATVDEVISRILEKHQRDQLLPALLYDCPKCYDLHNMDEYDDDDDEMIVLPRPQKLRDQLTRKELSALRGEIHEGRQRREKVPEFTLLKNKLPETSNKKEENDSTITVHIGQLILGRLTESKITIDQDTTAEYLLTLVAKKHKLKLLRERFVFTLHSKADEVRLRWTCPGDISDQVLAEVPMDANIMFLGVKHICLDKKMYADMPRMRLNKNPLVASTYIDPEKIQEGYEEWVIVQKNSFGRDQERILAIDSNFVYTRKRDKQNTLVQEEKFDLGFLLNTRSYPGDPLRLAIVWCFDSEGIDTQEFDFTCRSQTNHSSIKNRLTHVADINSRRMQLSVGGSRYASYGRGSSSGGGSQATPSVARKSINY